MRKRYIALIIGLFFMLIGYGLIRQDFYENSPKIHNYKPTAFKFQASEATVFREGKNVYYCKKNQQNLKSSLIYTLKDLPESYQWTIALAPNGEFITIKDDDELFIIDKEGKNKTIIGKAKSDLSFEYEKDRVRWKDLQWSENSQYILVIKDKEGKGRIQGHVSINEIFIFDLAKGSFSKIGEVNRLNEIYFSVDNQYIYYSFWQGQEKKFRRFSLTDQGQNEEYSSFTDSLLFINFTPYDLQNHTSDMESLIVDFGSRIYHYSEDTLRLIMKSSSGYGKVSPYSSHSQHHSYFLPGNRYYVFRSLAWEYSGNLIVDIKEGAYQEMNGEFKFYFNLNSQNVPTSSIEKGYHRRKPKYLYGYSWRTDRLSYHKEGQVIIK